MISTLFAVKMGMTGVFTPEGEWVGATVMRVLPAMVESRRTVEKHGYKALRLKLQDIRSRKQKLLYREVRTEEEMEPGREIKLEELLTVGDKVRVSGISKGKGTAGVVKRHNFRGGPRTHGQSDRERAPGSSGSNTTPGRVLKGKRRAGHMGVDKVTVPGLKVLDIDAEKGLLTVGGSVPGHKFGLLTITKI